MPQSDTFLDCSNESPDGSLPSGWEWEKFKVVDAGSGLIALWSPTYKRFIRMNDGNYLDKSGESASGTLPSGWTWEKFKVVDAGSGLIGLWNPRLRRFIRMNNGRIDRSSERSDGSMPSSWQHEKFRIVKVGDTPPGTPSGTSNAGRYLTKYDFLSGYYGAKTFAEMTFLQIQIRFSILFIPCSIDIAVSGSVWAKLGLYAGIKGAYCCACLSVCVHVCSRA